MKSLTVHLGLDKQYRKVMADAARHHMSFFDLGDNAENGAVSWVLEAVKQFDYQHDPAESTVYSATPWEMIDLIQADHEGRLDATDGKPVRLSLDREPYENAVEGAIEALTTTDGYSAMRTGLCDAHSDDELSDEVLQQTLVECDECRTPDSWIHSEVIDQARRKLHAHLHNA